MASPRVVIGTLLLGLAACQEAAPANAGGPALAFELDASPFADIPTPSLGRAFTVLANDADLDGDPDVLVNWHVFAPPALLWNEGGRYRRGERAWSLPELAAAPLLDGSRRPMLDAVEARTEVGVYLWHSDRTSTWFLALRGPFPESAEPATLVIECNRPIAMVRGKQAESYPLVGGNSLRVPLRTRTMEHAFFATQDVGLQVRARIEGATIAVPFFVGPEFARTDGPVELWGRDPHGVAWLDVAGSPLPDLVIVRGALRGLLQPPQEGKFDDFWIAEGERRPSFVRRELPRSHGRGRAVQWVDVDGDGRLELYVGNKSSANMLLAFDPAFTRAEDRASAFGLDLQGADAFVWFDLEGDGDEDLVTLDAREGLGLLRNEDGRRFARLDAAERGLLLPVTEQAVDDQADQESEMPLEEGGEPADARVPSDARVIDQHDLALLDADDDGDLDLLVTGWGSAGSCALFRAEGERFTETTASSGLAEVQGVGQAVVADFDADAWLDLLCLGPTPALFHNQRGHFQRVPLPEGLGEQGPCVAAACDADGDGRVDVVLASRGLVLARNRTEQRGAWVPLTLAGPGGAPVGAVVRARYADGSVQASRAGSCLRGHLAQAFGVIPLATSAENPLRRIEVRFQGGARVVHEVVGPGPVRLESPGR